MSGQSDAAGMTPPAMGSFVWQELNTRNIDASKQFFGGLLGWTFTEKDMGPLGKYVLVHNGSQQIGGMMPMVGDEWGDMASHWMTYIAVPDVDASAAKVVELGGKVCVPPMDIPDVGRFAVINDPSGAAISLITFPNPAG